MAIKVALAAALMAALVALSAATSYISMDEEGSQNWQKCRMMVQGAPLHHCESYLQQSGPYNDEEEFDTAYNTQQQFLQQCCHQLRQMERQHCGCEALRHAVRQAQIGGSGYRKDPSELSMITQRARALPRKCRMRQQQCRFNSLFL